jgi:hypothetical protein
VGYVDVYRNGVYLPSADYTATTGTTVVLTNAATAGDTITTISFYVSSVLNAIPATPYAVTASYMPSGSIIQVVGSTLSTYTNTTSTSAVDTGLSATITPYFSNSKILVFVNIAAAYTTATGTQITFSLVRNGSTLIYIENTTGYSSAGGGVGGNASTNYLDSPASGSAITYKIQWYRSAGSGTIYFNNNAPSANSNITLMEVRQ